MKICVCSLSIGDDYKDAVHYCCQSLIKYCSRNNYPLITEGSYIIEGRDCMWNKIPLIRKTMEENYDYIVWIDGDMMIMNNDFKLESLIELYLGNKDMMLSIDSGNQINTGFWVFRNNSYNKKILDLIENLPDIAGLYHEQGVFNNFYEKNLYDIRSRSRILGEIEQRLFNGTMYTFVDGDFLIHFLGIRNLKILRDISSDHYLGKKSLNETNETNDLYEFRMKWLKDKYVKGRNCRYIDVKPKIRIDVCTFYSGEKYSDDVVKYGQKSMKEYCNKHKYSYIVEKNPLITNLPLHWNKIALLLKLCKISSSDYIVWFDADVLIINQDIKIEDVIEKHMNGKNFLLCRDVSEEINTGVWIMRNTDYSRDMLELMLNLPELRYRGYEDQDTFNKVYEKNLLNFQHNCNILGSSNQNVMNCCVGCYHWGDWLIHFYSLSSNGLKDAFCNFYPYIKEDEHKNQYETRLNWIKNYNKRS